MNKEPNQEKELIRKFMEQSLSKKEHSLFDQKMKKEDFANRVAEESVRLSSRAKLRSDLKGMHKDLVVARPRKRMRIAIAAIFTLFLFGAFLYSYYAQNIKTPTPELAFATYFEPYPNLFEQRNPKVLDVQKFQQALAAYDNADYQKAVLLFDDLMKEENRSGSYIPFYYGISLLADMQASKAIPLFQEVSSNDSSILKSESKWYLALAHLQLGQDEAAQKILLEMQSDSNGFNAKQVELVLQDLRK